MKFSLVPSDSGTFVNPETARRFNIATATAGRDYTDEAAFTTAMKLVPFDVFSAQKTKLIQIQKAYDDAISAGFADATTGAVFAITDSSITQLHRLQSLLDLSGTLDDSPVVWGGGVNGILNIHNVPVPMTYGAFKALMVRLGNYVAGLLAQYGGLQAAIGRAGTVAAVNGIAWHAESSSSSSGAPSSSSAGEDSSSSSSGLTFSNDPWISQVPGFGDSSSSSSSGV